MYLKLKKNIYMMNDIFTIMINNGNGFRVNKKKNINRKLENTTYCFLVTFDIKLARSS